MDELFVKGNQKETAHASFKALCGFFLFFLTQLLMVMAFSSLAKTLGECSTIHSLPVTFFFLGGGEEINSCTLIPLIRPGTVHSGSAS